MINWSFSLLGKTFQEVKDIYRNGRIIWLHSDLSNSKEKILSIPESAELLISTSTKLSEFFIFRDYAFNLENVTRDGNLLCKINIVPQTEPPSSPTLIFFTESFYRIAKAVVVVVLTILTSPLWILILISFFISNRHELKRDILMSWERGIKKALEIPINFKFPEAPKDSHFTLEDIRKIGTALIGYRHVSTEQLAVDNVKNGILDGCSLNISFCKSKSSFDQAIFENLDQKVLNRENCDELIEMYEKSITKFIIHSISMDLPLFPAPYKSFFETLTQTHFMIVKTMWKASTDLLVYWNLGRFPKESISSNNITLLPLIRKEELKINNKDDQMIRNPKELKKLTKYVASFYRQRLLHYLRNQFDPKKFNSR